PPSTPPVGTTAPPSGPGTGETSGAPAAHNPQLAGEALNRLKDAGFVDVKDTPANGADLAVIVAPAAAVGGDDPGRTNNIYLSLARSLDTGDDGTVMAGNAAAAQENGAIWALRRNDQTAKSVSTVDTAETPAGQVAVVWALVVEEKQGNSGQYGVTGTTDGPLPTLPKETP
ncbi:copper transporter, partial [Streptomyces sp. SID3343]|uniref:copper transporter n=1 Tax=Streptomyces sp. SID3343 TaxID=2690260 RepID=UPI00136B50E8